MPFRQKVMATSFFKWKLTMRYTVPGLLEMTNLLPLTCPARTSRDTPFIHVSNCGTDLKCFDCTQDIEIILKSSWNHLEIILKSAEKRLMRTPIGLHHNDSPTMAKIVQGLRWAPQSLRTIDLGLGMLGFKTSLVQTQFHTPFKPYSSILHLPSFSIWMLLKATPKKGLCLYHWLYRCTISNDWNSCSKSPQFLNGLWQLRRRDLFGLLGMVSWQLRATEKTKNWQLKQDVQKISKISKLLQLRKAGAGAGCTSKHSISKGESESNESNSHVCVVQGLERPARSRRRLDEKPMDVVWNMRRHSKFLEIILDMLQYLMISNDL